MCGNVADPLRFAEEVEVALVILEERVDVLPFVLCLDSPRIDKLPQKSEAPVDTCLSKSEEKKRKSDDLEALPSLLP